MRIIDFFDKRAAQHPRAFASLSTKGKKTWAEAQAASNRIGHALLRDGIFPGSKVADHPGFQQFRRDMRAKHMNSYNTIILKHRGKVASISVNGLPTFLNAASIELMTAFGSGACSRSAKTPIPAGRRANRHGARLLLLGPTFRQRAVPIRQ